jgi:hypothetical protein
MVSIIKWWFSIFFHIYCVVIIFRYIWYYCSIFYSSIWNLTSGIRALSLAGSVGKYFYFLQIYFFRKKKAVTFWMFYIGFGEKISHIDCISEFLS